MALPQTILSPFSEENKHFEKEESRLVKVCILKYKCFLAVFFVIFTIAQLSLLALIKSDFAVIESLENYITKTNTSSAENV